MSVWTCARPGCGHSSDMHRLDDSTNVSPCDPRARFRCLHPGPDTPGPMISQCGCPHFGDPQDER